MKLRKSECDLRFLLRCKSYEVLPKFLYFKLYKKNILNSNLYKKWQFKLLNLEIKSKNKLNNNLLKLKHDLENSLKQETRYIDFIYLKAFVFKSVSRTIVSVTRTHEGKLEKLGINNNLNCIDPKKVIFNISSRSLTEKEESLLSFGLNFKLPNFKINYFKFFLSFEKLYNNLSKLQAYNDNNLPPLKICLQNLAYKAFYNFKPYKIFSPIFSKSDITVLRNLSKDKNIVICKPDKGHGVVIMDKTMYIEKMLNILNDKNKFIQIKDIDPLLYTLRNEDKLNNRINNFKRKGLITEELASKLTTSGSSPGIMYGLPKIHKSNTPLRPILSANNTTMYQLSQFFVKILSNITTNNYSLKNSYDFAQQIQSVINSDDFVMCSFDITSLFTNIPLDETIQIILDQIFHNPDTLFQGLNKAQFKSLLELATKNSNFIFDGKLYKQIDGVAMGSPCGPTLANIFLCYYESIWLENCPSEFKPEFYKRYVDDTFLLFKKQEHINKFLEYLNSKHKNIKFTKEVESEDQLSFLDILIKRENNVFTTSIYRKKTFTGLGSHFLSEEPFIFKINTIKTLIYRAYHLSSNYFYFHKEIDFLKTFFHNNGFPQKLFLSTINKFLVNIYKSTTPHQSVKKCKLYVSFPYYGYLSKKLKDEILKIISRRYPQVELNLVFTNKFSVGSFFRFKEKLTKSMCSCVIYKYECLLCQKQYIGSTIRQLQCRIAEHSGLSVRTGQPLVHDSTRNSSIFQHSNNCPQKISLENFEVLGFCDKFNIRTLEAMYIYKSKPNLNRGLPVDLKIIN